MLILFRYLLFLMVRLNAVVIRSIIHHYNLLRIILLGMEQPGYSTWLFLNFFFNLEFFPISFTLYGILFYWSIHTVLTIINRHIWVVKHRGIVIQTIISVAAIELNLLQFFSFLRFAQTYLLGYWFSVWCRDTDGILHTTQKFSLLELQRVLEHSLHCVCLPVFVKAIG